MRIICDESIRPAWFPHAFAPPELSGVFLAKITCQLQPDSTALVLTDDQAPPLIGDVHIDDDPAKPLRYATDFSPFKPRCDLLLHATAHAPFGKPISTWDVRWRVGEWSKSLRIFGDRQWVREPLSIRATPPQRVSSVALDYRLAFGNEKSKYNPLGRGWGSQAKLLPNIELIQSPIQHPGDEIRPAGFGPLDASWLPRSQHVGTYDAAWNRSRWPWFPKDFDYAFFNASPTDQQLERGLVGNEELVFENLHPAHSVYRTRLPGVRVRCFISEIEAGEQFSDDQFREVTMQCDTLQIDLHQEIATLIWRGHTPIRSLKMREIGTVYLMLESVDRTLRTPAECLELYRQKIRAELGADLEEVPSEAELAAQRDFDQKMATIENEYLAAMQAAERQESAARAEAIAAGIDPAKWDSVPEGSLAEFITSLGATAESLRIDHPELARQLDEEIRDLKDLEALEREMVQSQSVALTRESVERMALARESFAGLDLAELELYDLDLSGLDFRGADFSECMLDGTNFAGANLANTKLVGADLTDANLEEACLDGADFSEAILENCRLAKASVSGTVFSDLEMTGLTLRGVHGYGADFSGATLTGADFRDAQLPQANFAGANLVNSNFEGADLEAAQFDGATASKIRLSSATLRGLHASGGDFSDASIRGAVADGSIWEESILDRADFSGASLEQSLFACALMRDCRLDRSNLCHSVFDDADLSRASLNQSNLIRTSMDRAKLTQASMRESNLFQVGCWDADFSSVDWRGTSVRGTVLPS